eukprot:tig00000826_g4595.t1
MIRANIETNEDGEVISKIPDDLPSAKDLVPKAGARHLLQAPSGPLFQNGALLGMTTTDLATGESTFVDGAMQFQPRPVGLAAPALNRVRGATFRSASVAFFVPVNEAYDVTTSQPVPISKVRRCSLLSLGVDEAGAETVAEVASVVPDEAASEMVFMADRLTSLTTYRFVATCSNALGSSPRSEVVTVATPAEGIRVDVDAIGRPGMGGSFIANAPIARLRPMAAPAERTACVPGTFFAVPSVEIGRFSDGVFADAMAVNASLSPAIPEGSTTPSTSVCFVIPASPFARSTPSARHLLALMTGTAHALRVTDSQTGANVVIENAVIWQPAAELDANRAGLNCTSLGAIRRCASRSPRRLGASSPASDFSLAGTFAAAPTSVMVGLFDLSTGGVTCAHPATNVRLCDAGLCFQLPLSPPAGCAVGTSGTGTGRALLLSAETTYDLRIEQADGEQVVITNFVQWSSTSAPAPVLSSALSSWSQSQAAQAQSGGTTSHVGLGLGLGLGLGAVLLIVGGLWGWNYYRMGQRRRAQPTYGSAPHAAGASGPYYYAPHSGAAAGGTTINL